MNLNLKSTVSIFALTLCLMTPNAFSMQADEHISEVAVHQNGGKRETLHPSKYLSVDVVRDTTADSGSVSMFSYGDIKEKLQTQLSATTGHKDIRRILELDGGGVRGLFSILELCVLEEIINHPINQEIKEKLLSEKVERFSQPRFDETTQLSNKLDDTTRLYIRDLFDVGTGTSTGSILTAGLFSEKNYPAIEVAKLYARYGYKIFDEHKRYVIPGIKVRLTCATYDNKGLKTLLQDHFGNARLQDVHKPIYIVALNENKQEAAIFSTKDMASGEENLHRTHLMDAVLYSSSAPTYLPGVTGRTDMGSALFSDGGTVANNSAHLVFKKEKKSRGNPFEIYSFGTGVTPPAVARSDDSGVAAVATILTNTLVAQEKLAYTNCIDEMEDFSSQLNYFARINPKLEVGMDKLDDTSETYVQYAIKKAFSVTQGPVFADMVARLGFQMPEPSVLQEIHTTIRKKLDSLKSNDYNKLGSYEKEFVIKKVLDLDFMFYQKGFYQVSPTGPIMQMTHEEAATFLNDLMGDIAQKKKAGDGLVSSLWSKITTSNEDNILEFIPRCLEFHKIANDQITLTAEDFSLLATEKCELTQEQLKALSPNRTINGEGWMFGAASKAQPSDANKLVFNLFTKFIECCDSTEAQYQYSTHTARYVHLPALIFWKDMLKNLEGQVTKNELTGLKDNLADNISQIMASRANVSRLTAKALLSTRYGILVNALDTYIDKFCKD